MSEPPHGSGKAAGRESNGLTETTKKNTRTPITVSQPVAEGGLR